MKPFHRKQNRLITFDYQGQFAYSITICTFKDKRILNDKTVFDKCLDTLKEVSKQHRFDIWTFCFMPDHLHLVIMGQKNESNASNFIKSFKQKTGFWFKREFGKRLWQKNYYDHILRNEEKLRDVCVYVLNNPVRAELMRYYLDYPYSGSLVFDIENF